MPDPGAAQPSITQPLEPSIAQRSSAQWSPAVGHRAGEGVGGTHGHSRLGWKRTASPGGRWQPWAPVCACSTLPVCPPKNGCESTVHITCVLPRLKPILVVGGRSLSFALILLLLQDSEGISNRTEFLQFINP